MTTRGVQVAVEPEDPEPATANLHQRRQGKTAPRKAKVAGASLTGNIRGHTRTLRPSTRATATTTAIQATTRNRPLLPSTTEATTAATITAAATTTAGPPRPAPRSLRRRTRRAAATETKRTGTIETTKAAAITRVAKGKTAREGSPWTRRLPRRRTRTERTRSKRRRKTA